MTKNEQAAQLRLAAEIIENDLPWEFRYPGSIPQWMQEYSPNKGVMWRVLNGFQVRKMEADAYAELKAAHKAGHVIQVNSSGHWLDCGGLVGWTQPVDRYRIKPWSLHDHVAKFFRPLKDGEKFHREDFTRDMLPDGWRPLLEGEICHKFDEQLAIRDEWESFWKDGGVADDGEPNIRTQRQLPSPVEYVPLEASDVLPASVIRPIGWGGGNYVNYEAVVDAGIRTIVEMNVDAKEPRFIFFKDLKKEWEINQSIPRTGKWDANAWEACRKPSARL